MRVTWITPEDLVGHGLRQAELDGVDEAVTGLLRRRWTNAGGDPEPVRSGGSEGRRATDRMRRVALEILDELDALDTPADLNEPTELDDIVATLPTPPPAGGTSPGADHYRQVHGAWLGRAAGCLLGKPVEKIPREGIREILTTQGRWPLNDWFTAAGLPEAVLKRWPWNRRSAVNSLAENIDGMPEDDDLNYPMLNLGLLEEFGADLTSNDVAGRWLTDLPAGRVFTAERLAYRNLLLGHEPPTSARVRNPFCDWIGAQIRGDLFGWALPGDPRRAAALAWRDAVVSHTRNGVYGEMFVAAACSAAVAGASIGDALDAGLSVVPPRSRYAETVRFARGLRATHNDWEAAVDAIDQRHANEHWVHVLGNTALVVAALDFGDGDFTRSVCHVVSGGRDTDSNGATVGSIVGAVAGADDLPDRWIEPLHNRVASTLPGFDGIGFDTLARRTVAVAGRLAARDGAQ